MEKTAVGQEAVGPPRSQGSRRGLSQLRLKITGTSNFFLLTPQMRAGKTVLTQKTAEATDLVKGQSVAVIYAEVEKEQFHFHTDRVRTEQRLGSRSLR